MESFLAENLGINRDIFHWVIIPLFIFTARICDVSISTIRVMFVLSGRRNLAPVIGFFEALIWLVAIGQILQNISNVTSYIAYAAGFATGTFVGMYIEEKLALGKVIVNIITQRDASQLLAVMREKGLRITNVDGQGSKGKVSVIFTVANRKDIPALTAMIKQFNPRAFYTIENVKFVSDSSTDLPFSTRANVNTYFSLNSKRK
jgi:uncharacterized protein YebE (UPF0316 family)